MVFQGGKQVIKLANTSISSLLFAVRASTVATALKKVTIIYPRFAIILIKRIIITIIIIRLPRIVQQWPKPRPKSDHSRLLRILVSYLTEHTQPPRIKIRQLDYFAI